MLEDEQTLIYLMHQFANCTNRCQVKLEVRQWRVRIVIRRSYTVAAPVYFQYRFHVFQSLASNCSCKHDAKPERSKTAAGCSENYFLRAVYRVNS